MASKPINAQIPKCRLFKRPCNSSYYNKRDLPTFERKKNIIFFVKEDQNMRAGSFPDLISRYQGKWNLPVSSAKETGINMYLSLSEWTPGLIYIQNVNVSVHAMVLFHRSEQLSMYVRVLVRTLQRRHRDAQTLKTTLLGGLKH